MLFIEKLFSASPISKTSIAFFGGELSARRGFGCFLKRIRSDELIQLVTLLRGGQTPDMSDSERSPILNERIAEVSLFFFNRGQFLNELLRHSFIPMDYLDAYLYLGYKHLPIPANTWIMPGFVANLFSPFKETKGLSVEFIASEMKKLHPPLQLPVKVKRGRFLVLANFPFNTHYVALEVPFGTDCTGRTEVIIYDSMTMSQSVPGLVHQFLKRLASVFAHTGMPVPEWVPVFHDKHPQQLARSNDCGVFSVLSILCRLLNVMVKETTIDSNATPFYRLHIAQSIIANQLKFDTAKWNKAFDK